MPPLAEFVEAHAAKRTGGDTPSVPSDFVAIFGNPNGLAWVLTNQQLIFERTREREARRLSAGDRVLLFGSRNAFIPKLNGRVFGLAEATRDVDELPEPVTITAKAGRETQTRTFDLTAAIAIRGLAPYRQGVEVQPLLGTLSTFPTNQPSSWQPLLRRPLLLLNEGDLDIFLDELQPLLTDPGEVVGEYLAAVA